MKRKGTFLLILFLIYLKYSYGSLKMLFRAYNLIIKIMVILFIIKKIFFEAVSDKPLNLTRQK